MIDQWAAEEGFCFPKAVSKLLTQDYWTRVWILRELVLAKSAVLYSGSQHIPIWIFEHLCDMWKPKRNSLHHPDTKFFSGDLKLLACDSCREETDASFASFRDHIIFRRQLLSLEVNPQQSPRSGPALTIMRLRRCQRQDIWSPCDGRLPKWA